MEHQILLIFSFFYLTFFFNPANTDCVPRLLSDLEGLGQSPSKIAASSTVFSSSSPVYASSSTVLSSPPPRSQPTQRQASSPYASSEQSPAPADPPTSDISAPSGSVTSPTGSESIYSFIDAVRGASVDPAVQKICEQTSFPSVCVQALAPVFNGHTDPLAIAELLINATSRQTKLAIGTASKMASASGLDEKASSAFADCKDLYDEALDNLQEAVDAIPSEDIETIQTMLSAAIADYATCDDGFTGQPDPEAEGVSPLAAIDEDLMSMTDNILAIVNSDLSL